MAMVGAGAAIATSVGSLAAMPRWVPLLIAFGAAMLAVVYTHRSQPRKIAELRAALLRSVIAAVAAASLVWTLIALAAR